MAGKFKQWANSVLEPGVLNDENIQRKRDLAQMLLDQSTRGAPIQHRNQGYKMLMDALNAQIYRQQASRGEKALNAQRAKQMGEIMALPLSELQIQDVMPTDVSGAEMQGPPVREETITNPRLSAASAAAAQDKHFAPYFGALAQHELERTAAQQDAAMGYEYQAALAERQNQFDRSKVETDGQSSVLTKNVPGLGNVGDFVRIFEQNDPAGNVFTFALNEQRQPVYVPSNAYQEAPKTELTGQAAGGSIFNNPKAWETMQGLKEQATSDATMYEASSQALNILQNEKVFRGPMAGIKENAARFMTLLNAGNSQNDAMFFKEFKDVANQLANTEQLDALGGVMVGSIIKLFGSGTGLSDADREYAKLIVAALQSTTTKGAIRILTDISGRSKAKLQSYNESIRGFKNTFMDVDIAYRPYSFNTAQDYLDMVQKGQPGPRQQGPRGL